MAAPDDTPLPQPAFIIPDCGCGAEECTGPQPVPWLPWRHCFKFYEFRNAIVPVAQAGAVTANIGRLTVRVRYEHAFCLLGRKQGPIVHSLTLLPKEQVRIYEYDRYRRATSATSRFSVRSSFFTMTQKVQDTYASTKTDTGGSISTSSSATAEGGGGIDLGIVSFGGGASVSTNVNASAHFDVQTVSERFSHIAETSSLAVETERSIVVSTFEETESGQSTARILRNDNACRAVTYFIRRVFEVYTLTSRIISIEVLLGDSWIALAAAPPVIQDEVKKFLQKIDVGAKADPKVEIALPTDGLLYEAELAHCCSCDCESEAKQRLELEKLQLENLALRLEAERQQKRLDAGELDSFNTATTPPADEG